MSGILDSFREEMNQIMVLDRPDRTYNATTGRSELQTTKVDEIPCAYYIGSSAEALVGDKYKTEVDAVIIIDPQDLGSHTIEESDILQIDGKKHTVIVADDVMFLGEVLVVGVSRR